MTTTNWEAMTSEQLADFCAQKQQEIAALTKEQDSAKKVLFGRLVKEDREEVVTPFGRFYRVPKTAWVYPEDIVLAKNKLAEAEEQAKLEGRAEKKETFYYKYGTVKLDL